MGGIALLFTGQGTQHAQMLPWLEQHPSAAAALAAMAGVIGADWRARLHESDWAHRNAVAQPLVVGTALAAWAALSSHRLPPLVAVAGYSVGELAACAAAGVFTTDEAVALARRRAEWMDEAVLGGAATGLLSIAGLAEANVRARFPELEASIRLDPDHVIYAGTVQALDAARVALGNEAVCKPIDVSLASHSSWMRSAASAFATGLAGATMRPPHAVVACAVDGRATRDAQVLRNALARQIDHPLEWQRTLATVAERRPACVLEIGAGRALAARWERQHPSIPVRAIEDFARVEGAAAWLARHG